MGRDKIKHFLVNMIAVIIVSCSTSIFWFYVHPNDICLHLYSYMYDASMIAGGMFSLGLSIGNEYGDSKAEGNVWDWKDIFADLAGCLTGIILYTLGFVLIITR